MVLFYKKYLFPIFIPIISHFHSSFLRNIYFPFRFHSKIFHFFDSLVSFLKLWVVLLPLVFLFPSNQYIYLTFISFFIPFLFHSISASTYFYHIPSVLIHIHCISLFPRIQYNCLFISLYLISTSAYLYPISIRSNSHSISIFHRED